MGRRIALAVAFALAVASSPRPAAADLEVVMLDPDANLSNVGRLRKAMLAFLRTIDPAARFTTFTKSADLAKHLENHTVHFAIVRDRERAELSKVKLAAVLVPVRGRAATYVKVLLVRRGTNASDISVVATTSPPADVRDIEIPGRKSDAPKLRVLRVSKGFDALLGMAFERADAAYVTPETVAALRRADPKLAGTLVELYRSPPIPNPPLYAVVGNVDDERIAVVKAAFAAMSSSSAGRAVLALLTYTGWREP